MPILDSDPSAPAGGRIIRLEGLPDFNAGDPAFRVTGFDGWFATPTPDAVYTGNGGGAGGVASGAWLPKEQPMLLAGFIWGEQIDLPGYARALAAALPAQSDGVIQCLANGRDTVDLQIFVRRYDRAEMPIRGRLDFQIPLLALDPYKYGVAPIEGGMGVYSGSIWYESLINSSGWGEQFVDSSGWGGQFTQQAPSGPYGESLLLASPGGASSRRLTVTVHGPLTAGDWRLLHENTGHEMWVDVTVPDGQDLVIDCYTETAYMAGEDLTAYLFGDMLTLEAGGNTYRLTSPSANATAYALVSAYPAFEI